MAPQVIQEALEAAPYLEQLGGVMPQLCWHRILQDIVRLELSDVYIEFLEDGACIRYRHQGLLYIPYRLHTALAVTLVNYIKGMARLDVTQKRLPQDGGWTCRYEGRTISFRVAALACIYQENLGIRVLFADAQPRSFDKLGLPKQALQPLTRFMRSQGGMTFVTGPTGSGKTTTIHALLNILEQDTHKILTLEDPIEYRSDSLQQVAWHADDEDHWTTSGGFLKATLRQDPDVMVIGEVRDVQGAFWALQAVLTGHRVISSLHVPRALKVPYRLIELEADPDLVSGGLDIAVAQRLLRLLCPDCKVKAPNGYWTHKGCKACLYRGYQTRRPIFEIVVFNEYMRRGLLDGCTLKELIPLINPEQCICFEEQVQDLLDTGQVALHEIERHFRYTPHAVPWLSYG
jgi:type II secretory ATPase GspE/PulE/Tfp pilus assembly ATPase PilB-like protein